MSEMMDNTHRLSRINWFSVCYWAAASVQVVGSFNVFGTVGGSVLHAIAGALCLELLILALNAYGTTQAGGWMACICILSLTLIAASAMFQVADLLSHEADPGLATRLGSNYYAVLRTTVPMVPSVAMAAVTLIKFVDARRRQISSAVSHALQAVASAHSASADFGATHPGAADHGIADSGSATQLVTQAVEGAVHALRDEFAELHDAHARDTAVLQHGLQMLDENVQTLAADLAALAPAQLLQDTPLQLASLATPLQAAIAELKGVRLVEAVDQLVVQGFTKTAIASALGKPAYALAHSRMSKTEVL